MGRLGPRGSGARVAPLGRAHDRQNRSGPSQPSRGTSTTQRVRSGASRRGFLRRLRPPGCPQEQSAQQGGGRVRRYHEVVSLRQRQFLAPFAQCLPLPTEGVIGGTDRVLEEEAEG